MPGSRNNNQRMRMIKRALMGAAAAVLVGLLIYSFIPEPVPVDMASTSRGDIEVTIHGEGKSRIREIYVISAPITGRLLRIEREVGDRVTAGETVVATMQPADPALLDVRTEAQAQAQVNAAEAALNLAAAQLERKEAELDFANKELSRARELASAGNISQRVLDQRVLDVRTLQAEVITARSNQQRADAELAAARAALIQTGGGAAEGTCCVEVHSPVNGEVLRLIEKSENVVQAGAPLLEVGNLDDLELVIDLLSLDAVKVRPGDRAYIDHWGGPYELDGRVRLVEPSGFTKISALGIEEQRVNVIVDLTEERERWQSLGDGFRVEAFIVVDEKLDVLTAPVSALFREEGGWAVFRVDDGDAVLTPVSVGLRNEQKFEVLAGLSEDDRVITHPPNSVADGTSVTAR